MKFIDLSQSSRMARLMDLTQALRSCKSPYEALLMYCQYLRDMNVGRAHIVLSTSGLGRGEYRIWRLLKDDGIEYVELCNPWKELRLPVYSGGLIGRIIENATPQLVQDIDWSSDANFAAILGQYRSLIAVPLFNEGLPLNWSIILSREPEYFTPVHLEDSAVRATLMGSLLGSLHVSRELVKAHAQINAELVRMAEIQRALLPAPIPDIPGLELSASYQTFGEVGGDLYDFIPVGGDNDIWCIFIGDASGHGPAAAVVAAMVQAIVSDYADNSAGPADLFQILNRRLCQKRIAGSFVTAFMAYYDPSTRKLTYVTAGHPPPLLLTKANDHSTKCLELTDGLPLGIVDGAVFSEAAIHLQPGQTLLLYTDGITEARAPDGTMFAIEGIEQSLRGVSANAKGLIQRLNQSLAAHQGGRRPDDDQTAVAIHVQLEQRQFMTA